MAPSLSQCSTQRVTLIVYQSSNYRAPELGRVSDGLAFLPEGFLPLLYWARTPKEGLGT